MRRMHGDARGSRRWRHCLIAAVAILSVPACDNGNGNGNGEDNRPVGADGYSTAIDGFLPEVPADGSRPVVYIARLGDEPFPLEYQVAMIETVEETHDMRFVDDVDAAVDRNTSDAPPRDDGLLIGVGTISAVAPHVVRIEIYTAAGRIEAHKVTLSVRNDMWRVDTSEPVDPEVLVGDE
jgi:hypothetical protein